MLSTLAWRPHTPKKNISWMMPLPFLLWDFLDTKNNFIATYIFEKLNGKKKKRIDLQQTIPIVHINEDRTASKACSRFLGLTRVKIGRLDSREAHLLVWHLKSPWLGVHLKAHRLRTECCIQNVVHIIRTYLLPSSIPRLR